MMKRFYELLTLLIVLILPTTTKADVWQDPETKVNYEYTPGESEASVKAGTRVGEKGGSPDASGDITILSSFTVDGETYTVASIESAAFSECKNITSVTIPNTLKRIGSGAFYECDNLKSINLPESITDIGAIAFVRCPLTSISIPGSVKRIYQQTFLQCVFLKEVTIGEGIITIEGIEGPSGDDGGAFSWCTRLEKVTLPESLKEIGPETFGRCNSLSEVKLPKNLEKIEKKAFYGAGRICERFNVYSYIEEPFSLDDVFGVNGKSSDENTLYVPVGTKAKYEATNGWNVFTNIVEMEPENKEYEVGDTFTAEGITYQVTSTSPKEVSVGVYHTSSDDIITAIPQDTEGTIAIPSSVEGYSVTSIAYQAFRECTKIISVLLPNSIREIRPQAFAHCFKLSKVNIPSSVQSIRTNAFLDCWDLKTIILPGSITSIGYCAFCNCRNLKEVYSYAENPFAFDPSEEPLESVFDFYRQDLTLYIPVGTKSKYEATDGWKNFKNIVEMAVVEPIEIETMVNTDGLSGQDLTDNVVNGVYYNVGDGGYDATDGSIVISETTNMSQVGAGIPGTSEVRDNFTGLILRVAAGKGTIIVNVKTTGNAQLVVQVGNQTPMIATRTEQGDVVVSYDVTEDTYVYIYAIIGSSAARAMRAQSADMVKIYGITITSGATDIQSIDNGQLTMDNYYTLDGRKLDGMPTQKGLYIVNGRKVVIRSTSR